ncbi:MAG: GDPmannose 4,6-dehydratase [Parcubacteria group bacterium Gr01-1014_70]|nr:MAG: GDPmannose 4,6-dehydratase [Parcubacteria group bacterium Gr01-1014_70]
MKKAFITGITGQDGSYLAEFLLEKGYHVYGLQRRSSLPNTSRVDHLYDNPAYPNFYTVYGDLADSSNIAHILARVQPDEIYNLGAQSHVRVSFDVPEYTANITGLAAVRILESLRHLNMPARYYQASSSEMFGKVLAIPQNESTPFNPQSPYGISKTFAFWITRSYREGYGMFAANGILFNHESPRRGVTFVTRKITIGLSRVRLGLQRTLSLGNLNAKRDWGFSKDYIEAIWLILQHDKPDDFVIATGETHTVREFTEEAGRHLGIDIVWEGDGLEEKGIDRKTGKVVVEVDPAYFRPTEVELLQGDSTKARMVLGWQPRITFKQLAHMMAKHDYDMVKREVINGQQIEVHKPEV